MLGVEHMRKRKLKPIKEKWIYQSLPQTASWKDSGSISKDNIVEGRRKSSMRK
jgi:hypothetical protein